MNVKIEFSVQEANALLSLNEVALKAGGDSVVDGYMYFRNKIKGAFEDGKENKSKETNQKEADKK